jgi:hypothetical protein
MKKYLLGIVAVMAAIGLVSFTNSHKEKKSKKTQTLLYWYPVNQTTSRTSGAYFTNDHKSQVITIPCDDDSGQPICYYGSTDSAVPLNTYVANASPDNLIRKDD